MNDPRDCAVSVISEETVGAVRSFLESNLVPFRENYLLRHESYFKMGGEARLFVTPIGVAQLTSLLRYFLEQRIPYRLVGCTSNVIFLNELNYGVIVSTKLVNDVEVKGNVISVSAGYSLSDFVRVALLNGCVGLDGLEGIPGSIGGGVVMNAGAYGFCISDHISEVTCLNRAGELVVLDKSACKFTHRNSIFKGSGEFIVLSVKFSLPSGAREKSAREIEKYHMARHSYQEFAYPNLGSLFSIREDFYKELFRESRLYSLKCVLLKVVLRNRFSKFIMRRRPHNSHFNNLALKFLGMANTKCKPSPKSMNILVNNGEIGVLDIINYMAPIRAHLPKDSPVENEFVIGPLAEVNDKSKRAIQLIRENNLDFGS